MEAVTHPNSITYAEGLFCNVAERRFVPIILIASRPLVITKLLVANRGEIAIRAFRAAYELGIKTVAIYTREDRLSAHRLKADESYEIGLPSNPIKGYLDAEAIVATAVEHGADAVYPGYGFLSESPVLAEACEQAGITFVGPNSKVLRLTGSKIRAREAAEAAGLPVLRQSPALTDQTDATALAEDLGYPIFVKAAAGGGGRGMRRVSHPDELDLAIESARREAVSAFGDDTMFLEQAVLKPRHIEVQILGDSHGNAVHLFERDCSVQRRHQKVVEIAPAPNLECSIRNAMTSDAVKFAKSINYCNAGTIEYLLDESGRYVFIEMNPRIQVEHTVTEETTDVDLVQSQLAIAGGSNLSDLNLNQDNIVQRGFALQCRITTEDPANEFRPDTGRIVAYRQPGGAGIRLDGGGAYVGADISPYFDSLLVKLTCRGNTFELAVSRAQRALAEFRVRGVSTNLRFLQELLANEDFVAGRLNTSFLDERPHLMTPAQSANRATKLLSYLGDITVNRPHGKTPTLVEPGSKLGPPKREDPPAGTKQLLDSLGPDKFASWLRDSETLRVTDTTFRDAHQSIIATRMRTIDIVTGVRQVSHSVPELFSVEAWGGATFDVALRFLHEDPWDRLRRIRQATPNIAIQMLLRGRNTVGYSPYPDVVAERFVEEAHAAGVDIFRIFDALNDIEQMRPAMKAARASGAVVEGTLCYTGNLSDPNERLYTLDYFLGVAEGLIDAGSHILCIKDMAGLLRAPAASILVEALRERFDAPVHLHTHDTTGGQLATYLAAIEAGVDAVDGAAAPLSGMTSQPSLAAIVAATDHTDQATGISLEALGDMEPYWEAVRALYAPFEGGLRAPTGTVYRHQIPGGQLSNLRQQAVALGFGDRFEEIEQLYAACNELLGDIIKVTPSSKVVGDLALYLLASDVSPERLLQDPKSVDLPDSVIGFLHGELGTPVGGFPEPFRTNALVGRRPKFTGKDLSSEDAEAIAGDDAQAALSRLLFPKPATAQSEMVERYGDLSVLPTRLFWYGIDKDDQDVAIGLEKGVRVLVGIEAVGEPDIRGIRRVVFRLNGQIRPLDILDRSVSSGVEAALKADSGIAGHVAAPFNGVVTTKVSSGDTVSAGDPIAVIEAMKMESIISAPISGRIARVVLTQTAAVESGDLIVEITPSI